MSVPGPDCGASLRHDKVVDGSDALPDENAQERKYRNGAARPGLAADDLVGHRLSFTGKSFQIQSKDGTPLYAGTALDAWIDKQDASLTRPEAIRAMMETILHILSKDRGEKPLKAKRK